MTVTLEYLEDKNILVGTFSEPYHPINDSGASAEKLMELLQTKTGDIHYVADLREVEIAFSDLAIGMAEAFGNPNSPYINPRVKTYTVGSSALIEFGVKAATEQEQYGNIEIKLYKSVDEAFADIDSV